MRGDEARPWLPAEPDGGETHLSNLRYSASISLDGYVAGPDQGIDHPLGVGGERLHGWLRDLAAWRKQHGSEGGETNASTEVYEEGAEDVGAVIMGRNMFGGGPGPWGEPAWQGWWGDEPPFGMPVFVLTHHARESLELTGTTFTFVTEVTLHLVPTLLGGGVRLLDGLRPGSWQQTRAVEAPGVTHLTYRLR